MNSFIANGLLVLVLTTLNISCTKTNNTNQITQDWHPQINSTLQQLADTNSLIFGKNDKEDGRYCYVKYEGTVRNEEDLAKITTQLNELRQQLLNILEQEYSATALDLTRQKNTSNLDDLTQADKDYLQKKSELQCLRVIAERQVERYKQKVSDQRVSLR